MGDIVIDPGVFGKRVKLLYDSWRVRAPSLIMCIYAWCTCDSLTLAVGQAICAVRSEEVSKSCWCFGAGHASI